MRFIDSHVHYIEEDPWEYIETLLRRMDEHHVEKAVLFGVQGHPLCSDAGVRHVVKRYPDRFMPFACSIRCEQRRDAEVFLDYLKNWGPWHGVGEVYVDLGPHQPEVEYADRFGRQCSFPRYSPADKHRNQVYGEVFTYCGEHNLPALVHCVNADAMEELLTMFPFTKFIWAHVDSQVSEAQPIAMLQRYSNLVCEIGPQFRFEASGLLSGECEDWLLGRFRAWQEAAQRHPSRIVWGSDIFTWADLEAERYRRFVQVWELFADPLSEDNRKQVGTENLLGILATNEE